MEATATGNLLSQIMYTQKISLVDARELIKIKILETCPTNVKETAELIAKGTGADVVQTIGLKIVLFRVSDNVKNRTINIDKIKWE